MDDVDREDDHAPPPRRREVPLPPPTAGHVGADPGDATAAERQDIANRQAATDRQLGVLHARLDQLGHEQEATASAIAALSRGERLTDLPPRHPMADVVWACRKCGGRLGVYDPGEAILRVRYKDLYLWFHAGPGGWVETICRTCGHHEHVEEVGDAPPTP